VPSAQRAVAPVGGDGAAAGERTQSSGERSYEPSPHEPADRAPIDDDGDCPANAALFAGRATDVVVVAHVVDVAVLGVVTTWLVDARVVGGAVED